MKTHKAVLKKVKNEKYWSISIKSLGINTQGKNPKDAVKMAVSALQDHYEDYVGDAKGTCEIKYKAEIFVDHELSKGVAEILVYPEFFEEFIASRKNA